MRSLYRQRRDKLIDSLTSHARDLFELEPCQAGMHLIGWLRNRTVADGQAASAIWASGVDCLPVSIYCHRQVLRPGIMFGFACAAESAMDGHAARVAESVRSLLRSSV